VSVDRDRILEQALKHELRGDNAATPHLDAETLAAWQDDALNAAQMADIELHVSTCARCQSMLAAFARGTSSTLGTLGTPGTVGTPGTAGTPSTPGTFSWWRWWLAPLAAGAAAVTIWMVVPEQQQFAERAPAASVAVDKVQPPADVEAKKADAPAAEPERRARSADSDLKENKLRADAERDNRQQLKDQAVAAPKQEVAMAQPAAPPPPPAPAAPIPSAAPATAAAREEIAGARVGELQKSARLAFAPLEVPTLDRNVRWRISGGRMVERTDDNGANWRTLATVTDITISAGSAPSTSVAWFAGTAGVVVLTIDGGTTFRTLHLDEPLDIGSISASDARTAIVSTVSGRRFRTEDGGRSWRSF